MNIYKLSPKGIESMVFDLGGGSMDSKGSYAKGIIKLIKCLVEREKKINNKKIFIQNMGASGSYSIINLLKNNGYDAVHELKPDLEQIGLSYWNNEIGKYWIKKILLYTRNDVFIEANNRLFSMSKEIYEVFPNSRMIYLHRCGKDYV